MDLGLKEKVAFVGGASQGLGRAVAEELAAEGCSLVLCARSEQTLNETCDAIREKTGSHVIPVAGDLSIRRDIERMFNEGVQRFGRIDILVTNTGGPPAGRFEDLTP